MTFYIYVRSGLNNKLVPLLSLLRIARKEGRRIKCFWGGDAYMSGHLFSFLDLFESVDEIEFIDVGEYMNTFRSAGKIYNKGGSDRDRNGTIYERSHEDEIAFNKIVHLISYKDDNVIGRYVPYPRERSETTEIIREMRDVMKDLKPVQRIQDKIDSVVNTFNNNDVVGLHIRTTDGGFTDIPYKNAFVFISGLIRTNKDVKVYISCDNMPLECDIKRSFPDNVIFFTQPFGNSYADKFNRSSWGTLNAVCEMFILSKCNRFYGTPGSSFSFMGLVTEKR